MVEGGGGVLESLFRSCNRDENRGGGARIPINERAVSIRGNISTSRVQGLGAGWGA